MNIGFLEDLKAIILDRKLKVAELANQHAQLLGDKGRKISTINTLKEKYNQTLDGSLFMEITDLEEQVKAIDSQCNQIGCVLNGKSYKAKTSHNIAVELEDMIYDLGMKSKIEKIKEDAEQLVNSLNDYFEVHEKIRSLVIEVTGISDEVDINDLNAVLNWFGQNRDKYSFSDKDYKECKNKNIDGGLQRAYELFFSMLSCTEQLNREISRIQKEGK